MKQIKQLVPLTKTLIKIDSNGTKHYHVDACPRCGGTGVYDMTTLDNYRCWKCGATGYYPHTEKEYTEEYLAKKSEKAHKKWLEKNLANLPKNIRNGTPFRTIDAPIYAVKGDTYAIRNELKAKGARWVLILHTWVFDTPTSEYSTVEIRFDDICLINENNIPNIKRDDLYAVWDKIEGKN